MDVSGQTGLELFLATHGQRSTPAKRQYLGLRVVLRPLLRSHQRRRDCANITLITDIARRNGIRFDAVLGADIAQDYKPKARVFQASAEAFDLKPSECMMVSAAAHDFDIVGAAKAGLRIAAVARPDEFGRGSSLSTPKDPISSPRILTI